MRVYMLNKPRGFLTAVRDRSRPTVMELLPPELGSLHPIGRLDLDTEGLLLLTDEGRLDPLLLRPEAHVEKLYFFRAFGRLEQAAFDRMAAGVELEGTGVVSLPARAWLEGYSSIGACEALLPPKKHNHLMKNPGRPVTEGWIALREGRKHQVKLMKDVNDKLEDAHRMLVMGVVNSDLRTGLEGLNRHFEYIRQFRDLQ